MTTFSTYATATFANGNQVTVLSAENMIPGLPITFMGNTFGNVTANATYYIGNITFGFPTSNITLTSLPGGAVYVLGNGSGNMQATFTQGGQQIISTEPPGEPLESAFTKVNVNFDQIFAAGPVGSNIAIANNTIRTLDTNGNLVLNPNGIGNVIANAHVIPDQDRVRNLGAQGLRWNTVYAQNLVGNISGNIVAGGNNTQVQFNDNTFLAGNPAFIFDKTTNAVVATGTITGGNILTPGIVSSTSGVYGDIYTTMIDSGDSSAIMVVADTEMLQDLTVDQNLYVNNQISAAGNITGNNVFFGSGVVSGTGNIYANKIFANIQGNVDAAGNLTEIQFNTTGDQLGASPAFTFNNTANLLTVGGNVLATGIVSAGGGVYGNIVGPIPASSRIIYVAKNGNDANDGGLNAPFLTIRAAMAVATAGTSVHVAPGAYTEINPITIPTNVAMIGDNLRSVFVTPATPAADLFYMQGGSYVWGITIRNYLANGFSYDPATTSQNVFVSPYIQNITSATTTGTAVYIDGNATSAISTKAMILGFFTIINRGGRGVYLVNSAYSQAVNIYTIACDIGLKVESGAFCTLNGSDCSIGNFGLVADGVGPLQTSGTTVGTSQQGVFVLENLTDGSPHVNTVMKITGDPEYYTIDIILPNIPAGGQSTVYVQQTYTQILPAGTNVEFFTRSSIIASAHTFEYVGAGTDPATALPQYGGIPIEANEVIQLNGGVVTYTSTDQKGNFKVGTDFIVNQATGTITGDAFYKSLFAQMTPYILALST